MKLVIMAAFWFLHLLLLLAKFVGVWMMISFVILLRQVTAKILFGSVAAIQTVNAEKCRKK